MAQVEVLMPKMGESITEATIIQWSKQIGDTIENEETLLEIATDKVDSEIPAPSSGVLVETFYQADDVVAVGTVIGIISTEMAEKPNIIKPTVAKMNPAPAAELAVTSVEESMPNATMKVEVEKAARPSQSERFYTPLVRSIAAKENIDIATLNNINGTGKDNRVTKNDILAFLDNRKNTVSTTTTSNAPSTQPTQKITSIPKPVTPSINGDIEIIEMDRTRRLIADHMVRSKQTSAHVTSFVEVDVTDIVNWRNQVKGAFKEKHQENITFTPIFIEAVAKAIQDFPLINVSVEGNNILVKKAINIGMATALPSGNLIVPVIKNANQLNLFGLTKKVNELAKRARANELKPADVQGGTFTLTNVGTFGNVMGTPIINQPQVAIMSVGAIQKKPAVLETEYGDVIAIRHMMFISLSYDHRVVDGMLGGSFLRRVGDYMEQFDINQKI